MRYGQFVIGPAGSGKSTYCWLLQQHFEATKRTVHMVNLDPAAEYFRYKCSIDIRDCVSVDDVIEETDMGPNGGLVYAMEYVAEQMDWLEECLDEYGDEEYFIFDCPGQIELYTHLPVMRTIVDRLQQIDFRLCGVCCMDVSFISDGAKYISGSLSALSGMVSLELPHINILTKCDLVKDQESVDKLLDEDPEYIASQTSHNMPKGYESLTLALSHLLQEYSMVNFHKLDPKDEDSIGNIVAVIDMTIQYGENNEPAEIFEEED